MINIELKSDDLNRLIEYNILTKEEVRYLLGFIVNSLAEDDESGQ